MKRRRIEKKKRCYEEMMQLQDNAIRNKPSDSGLHRRFKNEKMLGREDAMRRRCNEEKMQ